MLLVDFYWCVGSIFGEVFFLVRVILSTRTTSQSDLKEATDCPNSEKNLLVLFSVFRSHLVCLTSLGVQDKQYHWPLVQDI